VTAVRSWLDVAADLIDPAPSRLSRYYSDPVAFADDCIDWRGEGLTPYQRDILAAIPREKRVSARGPHGLGKTTEAAIAVLWFALTREDAGRDWKCPTTASAWRQLEHYLWPEIHKWARRLRWDVLGREPFNERTELQTLNLKLHHGAAFAVASDVPALIEGVHADSVLYIFDEAKTIPAATFDAAEGAFSGGGSDTDAEAFGLAQSTPGEPSGRFHEIHQRRPGLEDWWVRHVTLDEAIAAGRVSKDWAEQRRAQWGEASALYANRALGEFHSADEEGVIPLAWVEAANERWRQWDEDGRQWSVVWKDAEGLNQEGVILGVDVARSGPDDTVMALRFASIVDSLRRTNQETTTQTASRAMGIIRSRGGGRAVVDVIGIGAGVVDQMRDAGFEVVAFNAAEGTTQRDKTGELGFKNKRSAAWWSMRELLDPDSGQGLALPDDDLLTGDLTAPHWRVVAGGLIQVESKDDVRKRLGRSTDTGDAVIQAFWESDVSPVEQVTYDRGLTSGRRAR
jgi:hypothetical protein